MRARLGWALSQIAIVIAAVALILFAWWGSFSAITAEREQAEARVEAATGVEALAFEEQVRRQLLGLEQTLRFLRHQQEANPSGFDLSAWRMQATLLNEVSGNLFLVDENGRLRDAGGAALAGLDLSGTVMVRVLLAATDADDRMFVGPATEGQLAPGWHMDLALRLRHPDGAFAGVIGITYPTSALARFFREAHLRPDDMIAVVGTGDARVRAEAGPVQVAPDADINDSAMETAIRDLPNGAWIGPSAPDGIDRLHAFRRVPDRDLEVVVAVDRTAALAAATTWAKGAEFFAGAITALVLLMAGLLLREVRRVNRRAESLGKEHARLAASNAELEAAKARADAKTAQLEATLAGMTDGVAMVDAGHCLMEWNDQFSEITGVPEEILRIGASMEELVRAQAEAGEFGPVEVEVEVARRMRLLRSARVSETNERARPDGRIIELRRNHLPDGGMVTLYTDITARKQVENALRLARAAAEEASAARARFVAIVSHEIRTPLNALLNCLLLLAEGELIPTQRGLLDLAHQSGEALAALLNDILDMSRLEAGQLALRRSVFALRPLLTNAMEMMRPLAARRGITLHLALDAELPHLLFTDPVRLRQVLLNLLSNAAKYAAPGEVLLIAESTQIDSIGGERAGTERAGTESTGTESAGTDGAGTDGGKRLRLAVRDQGPAIPEAERARLFQPFSQLDQPGADAQPSSGLGLAICRLLATLMDGAVGCDTVELSPMGQPRRAGNEFWMALPIDPLPPDAVEPADRRPAALPALPRCRILLVEDVIASRIVVARLLRRVGHMVDTAASGEAAIAAVSHVPYDVVLMDVHMPAMSGIDTARQIRILPGAAGAVPIIALTASTSPEDTVQCRAAGMNGLVTKPATLADLLGAIGRYAWPGRIAPAAASAMAAAHRPARAPDVPVLASARLDELRRHLEPGILGKLAEDSVIDLQQRLPALRDALGSGDAEAILLVAHAMAGVAGGYGMAALEAKLRAVMEAARRHNPAAAVSHAEDLESDLAQAAAALRDSLRIEVV
jgi:signal transduction histidine kinase/DNA-binding NarL/FixJ family response regulator